MEITKDTTNNEVLDFLRKEHWAYRKPVFFSKDIKFYGKNLYSYLVSKIL